MLDAVGDGLGERADSIPQSITFALGETLPDNASWQRNLSNIRARRTTDRRRHASSVIGNNLSDGIASTTAVVLAAPSSIESPARQNQDNCVSHSNPLRKHLRPTLPGGKRWVWVNTRVVLEHLCQPLGEQWCELDHPSLLIRLPVYSGNVNRNAYVGDGAPFAARFGEPSNRDGRSFGRQRSGRFAGLRGTC